MKYLKIFFSETAHLMSNKGHVDVSLMNPSQMPSGNFDPIGKDDYFRQPTLVILPSGYRSSRIFDITFFSKVFSVRVMKTGDCVLKGWKLGLCGKGLKQVLSWTCKRVCT